MNLLSTDRELARDSYYEANCAATAPRLDSFAPLDEAITADVAIVGGGLAGLSAAIELATSGLQVVLLEAGFVGGGASGRNGGQALAGLACDQTTIEAQVGMAEAKRIWAMSLEAIRLIRRRSEQYGINCEWQSGYLSFATSARKARELQAGAEHMSRHYGFEQRWIDGRALPEWIASPRFEAGLFDADSGHLHPLKYCLGLSLAAKALGVRIFEHSAVTKLVHGQQVQLSTPQGSVKARQVLLAGNVYLQEIAPDLAANLSQRIMPVGTYIACTAQLEAERLKALIPSRAAVCDTNFALDYFRPTADQRLLYGGRVSYSTAAPRDLERSMQQRILATFPQLQGVAIDYVWGGFVDITMNRAPDFGRLGPNANVYYLQGFSGHGLALTGLAGQVVAEAICGDAGRFDSFAKLRHRSFPGGKLMRMPALVLGMAYYRLKDMF